MGLFDFLKKPVKKIDDYKEFTENLIAKGFRKVRGNKAIDKGQVALTMAILTAAESYFKKTIPPEVKTKICDGVVVGCDKANILIVDQLEKH